MADYAKKKNDELATICKERGLAHTGKKADLVKRLEDYDNSATIEETAEKDAGGNADAGKDAPKSDAAANDLNGELTAENLTTTAAKDKDEKVSEDKAPAQDFSLGLEERTLDDEIEKRKKRAAKFGLDTSQDETLKQLERAKRFGTKNLPGLLNQALPERAERHKKRGREGKEDSQDRKRSRQRGGGQEKDVKAQATSEDTGAFPKWMTTSDREAAERRKAKFGTAN